LADIGVNLLMFGLGLHFHLNDLASIVANAAFGLVKLCVLVALLTLAGSQRPLSTLSR
jgi:predicted Kef-type K+ transport protein